MNFCSSKRKPRLGARTNLLPCGDQLDTLPGSRAPASTISSCGSASLKGNKPPQLLGTRQPSNTSSVSQQQVFGEQSDTAPKAHWISVSLGLRRAFLALAPVVDFCIQDRLDVPSRELHQCLRTRVHHVSDF